MLGSDVMERFKMPPKWGAGLEVGVAGSFCAGCAAGAAVVAGAGAVVAAGVAGAVGVVGVAAGPQAASTSDSAIKLLTANHRIFFISLSSF